MRNAGTNAEVNVSVGRVDAAVPAASMLGRQTVRGKRVRAVVRAAAMADEVLPVVEEVAPVEVIRGGQGAQADAAGVDQPSRWW